MQMLSQINSVRRNPYFHKQNNALAILTKKVKITLLVKRLVWLVYGILNKFLKKFAVQYYRQLLCCWYVCKVRPKCG